MGFRRLRLYQLRFAQLDDGTALLELECRPEKSQLVVLQARLEEWWVVGREP